MNLFELRQNLSIARDELKSELDKHSEIELRSAYEQAISNLTEARALIQKSIEDIAIAKLIVDGAK